jgi:hypothetical protein
MLKAVQNKQQLRNLSSTKEGYWTDNSLQMIMPSIQKPFSLGAYDNDLQHSFIFCLIIRK